MKLFKKSIIILLLGIFACNDPSVFDTYIQISKIKIKLVNNNNNLLNNCYLTLANSQSIIIKDSLIESGILERDLAEGSYNIFLKCDSAGKTYRGSSIQISLFKKQDYVYELNPFKNIRNLKCKLIEYRSKKPLKNLFVNLLAFHCFYNMMPKFTYTTLKTDSLGYLLLENITTNFDLIGYGRYDSDDYLYNLKFSDTLVIGYHLE